MMNRINTTRFFHTLGVFTLAVALFSGCSSPPLNKKQADEYYATWGSFIRWMAYQGSDQERHYFIARVMDSWRFFGIERSELTVADERPYIKPSSASLYHYLVEPRTYKKIEAKNE